MAVIDKGFGKVVGDGGIEYARRPLSVVVHHHDEWDEPVYDEETGEPTGETVHREYDWTTRKTVVHPTASDYAIMGFLPVYDHTPSSPAGEGFHWERRGFAKSPDGKRVERVYERVENPKPTISDFDSAMESHLLRERSERGYTTREPDPYFESSNPRWSADARDWVAHRDAVMEYALGLINAVAAGEREPPTLDEFRENLPKISWSYEESAE